MSVSITINADSAEAARKELLALLGNVELVVTDLPAPGEPTVADSDGGTADGPKTEKPIEPAKAADKPKASRKKADKPVEQPQIRTNPEARVDPEAEARDAADEAAETATEEAKVYTREDVRAAAGAYITAYGMDVAQSDCASVIAKHGESISKLPDDPAVFEAVFLGLQKLMVDNPFNRKPVANG